MKFYQNRPFPDEDLPKGNDENNQEQDNSSTIHINEDEMLDVDGDISSALEVLEKLQMDDNAEVEAHAEDLIVEDEEKSQPVEDTTADDVEVEEKTSPKHSDDGFDELIGKEIFKDEKEQNADLARLQEKINKLLKKQKKSKQLESQYKKKIQELTEEVKSVNGKWIRVNADYQNFQKRARSKVKEFIEVEQMKLIRDVLPMVENFKRALIHPEEKGNFKEGINLIFKQIEEILTNWKVVEISAMNEEFDPFIHEAVDRFVKEDVKHNQIIEVYETGYYIGDKVLRPAKVVVAYNESKQSDKSEQSDKKDSDNLNGKKLETEK